MDRDEEAGGAARTAGQELVSTGSLTSGEATSRWRRPRNVVLALVAAGLLTVAFLVQHGNGQGRPAPPAAAATSAQQTPATGTSADGPAFLIHADGATGRIALGPVERVQTDTEHSALAVVLHLEVSAGVETLTTDSFVVSDPDGATARASGVTVLVPGSSVVPSESGFRIAAPAALDLEVIVNVPPGDHVLSVVTPTQQKLAGFAVSG